MTPQGVNISEFQAALDDDQATAQTVAIMGSHVRNCYQDPEVRRCALEAVTSGRASQRTADIADCVWAWCKRNIRFVPDEVQLAATGRGDERELLISPTNLRRPNLPRCSPHSLPVARMGQSQTKASQPEERNPRPLLDHCWEKGSQARSPFRTCSPQLLAVPALLRRMLLESLLPTKAPPSFP
jgi:hypothetical protein